jgi:small subunit ribosomal protein S7
MSKEKTDIKLFNIWPFDNIEVKDVTLANYINLKPIIIPHSCGRHEHKKFWKSNITIIERFLNRLLAPGFIANRIKGRKSAYNSGKKSKLIKSFKTSLALVEQITGENPIQVLVDAIINTAPREETTRLTMAGISYATSVDVAPQRRIDLGIKYLIQAIGNRSHNTILKFEENVAQELITAAKNSQDSQAIKKKDEVERISVSAR